MRYVRLSFLFFLIFLNACSTIEHTQKKSPPTNWSNSEPLSIPYETRLGQFEKANLVDNHSFEEGPSEEKNGGAVDSIKGWQTIGRNVQWVDANSADFTRLDVNSGRHAFKIIRKKANELDEAEGVISDYIPVVPGNYYLSYHVKLKKITSNKFRLGIKPYDSVVVSVLFFDENRQPIEPGIYNPVNRNLIDNSDKGFSFANYWTIDEFDWAEVRGRTYNYPFSEGDIPDNTQYVRLFFGLKGRGAMWLDDIEFRYSKWNFTALERFKPYFERPLALEQSIIPTPKIFQKINDVFFYDSTMPNSHLPLIVLPENPASADYSAAKLLQKQVEKVVGRLIPAGKNNHGRIRIIEKDYSFNDVLKARLVFSIGRNKILTKVQPALPLTAVRDKPQGYLIKTFRVGHTDIVFIYGETALARYYAAATAIQLFDGHRAVYHNANVIDYPDFWGRSYVFKGWRNDEELSHDLNSLPLMSQYKLNKVYLGYDRPAKKWHQAGDLYRRGIKEAGRLCRDSGV